MLLTRSPYYQGKEAGGAMATITGGWFPRTFPLQGTYNDYGGVEHLEGVAQQAAWKEMFNQDLIERGWGDNSVHDVPTTKDMPLEDLIDAIHGGRLLVSDNVDPYPPLKELLAKVTGKPVKKNLIPSWVPTRKRVEKALKALGYELGGNAIMVTKINRMTIRVVASYMMAPKFQNENGHTCTSPAGEANILTTIRDQLANKWAGMVVAGRGGQRRAELHLSILPDTEYGDKDEHRNFYGQGASKGRHPLPVTAIMIRDDVWRTLVNLPTTGNWDGKTQNIETLYGLVKTEWDKAIAGFKGTDPLFSRALWHLGNDLLSQSFKRVPFTVGLFENWNAMVEAAAKGNVTPQEAKDFLTTVAQYVHVMNWLGSIRIDLKPAASGPQFGDFQAHHQYLKAMTQLAYVEARKQATERENW